MENAGATVVTLSENSGRKALVLCACHAIHPVVRKIHCVDVFSGIISVITKTKQTNKKKKHEKGRKSLKIFY